jgi:hypothetical protein
MADAHQDDPNAAPMHHDIQEQFSTGAVVFCYLLALAALVAGLAAGLTIIND